MPKRIIFFGGLAELKYGLNTNKISIRNVRIFGLVGNHIGARELERLTVFSGCIKRFDGCDSGLMALLKT